MKYFGITPGMTQAAAMYVILSMTDSEFDFMRRDPDKVPLEILHLRSKDRGCHYSETGGLVVHSQPEELTDQQQADNTLRCWQLLQDEKRYGVLPAWLKEILGGIQ